jgi:hypothetical protein
MPGAAAEKGSFAAPVTGLYDDALDLVAFAIVDRLIA